MCAQNLFSLALSAHFDQTQPILILLLIHLHYLLYNNMYKLLLLSILYVYTCIYRLFYGIFKYD